MSHKLLLADSSAAIQRLVELMFSAEGVEVVAVDDGQQAIERLPVERPDVVLAEIGIARRSGYEVAAFVKEHAQLSHVPVLLLAGAFEPVDEARVAQVRSAGVLVKPLEPQQVVARVRTLIESSHAPAAASRATSPSSPARTVGAPDVDPRNGSGAAVSSHSAPASSESRTANPETGTVRADSTATSLDDYFDRLDAAFATLGTRQPPAPPAAASLPHVDTVFGGPDIPTLDEVIGSVSRPGVSVPLPGRIAAPPPEPPDAPATLSASPPQRQPASPGVDALADLFRRLLAVEQGEADARSLGIGSAGAAVEVTDELVERVTRRVIERLGTQAVRELVADVVSEIAERLVREEIDRIRRG